MLDPRPGGRIRPQCSSSSVKEELPAAVGSQEVLARPAESPRARSWLVQAGRSGQTWLVQAGLGGLEEAWPALGTGAGPQEQGAFLSSCCSPPATASSVRLCSPAVHRHRPPLPLPHWQPWGFCCRLISVHLLKVGFRAPPRPSLLIYFPWAISAVPVASLVTVRNMIHKQTLV